MPTDPAPPPEATATAQTAPAAPWRRSLRSTLRWAVWLLIALALYYFVLTAAAHWRAISAWRPGAVGWVALICVTLVLGALLYLQAEVWHRLVNDFQPSPDPRARTYPSHALTQIAKYLPGNVFQFAGRYVWLARDGADQAGLIRASVAEIGLQVIAALLICGAGAVLGMIRLGDVPDIEVGGAWAIPALGFGLTIALAAIFARSFRAHLPSLPVFAAGTGLAAVLLLGQGTVFWLVAVITSGAAPPGLIFAAVAAWLAGFATPGAPAGLGVRELVLLTLSTPHLQEPHAIIAIALFRLVTTFADLVMFLSAWLLWHHKRSA